MSDNAYNFDKISEELNKLSHEKDWYEGNLKKNHAYHILDQHFYLLTDCDNSGNLQEEKYVFVEFAGIEKKESDDCDFLLICHKCHKSRCHDILGRNFGAI